MFSALALLLTALQSTAIPACGAGLEAARQAYGTYDVVAARRSYKRVADGACSAGERAEASTELARIIWLVDANGPAAVARLRTVPMTMPEGCAAAAMLGRILIETRRPTEVASTLAPALPVCSSLEPAVALAMVSASVALAADGPPNARVRAARAALSLWEGLSPVAQATLRGSRQRLALGLLAAEPAEASAGWRGFFTMDGGLAGGQIPRNLDDLLRAGLALHASEAARVALCDALIEAGFADEARHLAGTKAVNGPAWRSARAYFRMRDRLATILDEHDRAYASGDRSSDAGLEAAILATLRDAVAEAGQPGTDPWPALRRLWNLAGTTGRSNGIEGLNMGHVSTDVALSVRQGRRVGAVRFIALDNMIANGFSGWLGDGVTGPGGWAADGKIIQVRTRYVQAAFDRAAIASPGPARDAFFARLARLEVADRSLSHPAPGTFIPSLSARLQLSAVDALAAELRGKSSSFSNFAAAFASLWYSRSLDGTILKHEGRHALDQAQFPGDAALGDAELEFRAKLSELEYGASPKLALSNIYGRLLGGTTGHGVANLRLVGALTAWLTEHRRDVTDFDPAVPLVSQLWRIDDQQLREIAARLDPAERK